MKLNKNFFKLETEQVAQNLLGKIIKVGNKRGIIFETEAYKGNCDEASWAFGNKTPGNKLMYETYGFVYVRLIYGMYYLLNITADEKKPGAVLIRGVKDMETGKIYDGPGKLTKFFGIDKSFDGLDLDKTNKIEIYDGNIEVKNIQTTTRIGISKGKDKLWRFIGEI